MLEKVNIEQNIIVRQNQLGYTSLTFTVYFETAKTASDNIVLYYVVMHIWVPTCL